MKHVSAAQLVMLHELAIPNQNPENEWAMPMKYRRTGQVLVRLGLIKKHASYGHNARDIWSITPAGRACLREVGA